MFAYLFRVKDAMLFARCMLVCMCESRIQVFKRVLIGLGYRTQ